MELFKNTNYDFLGKKWPAIILSLVMIAAGIVSIIVRGGLRYGIDFEGGALMYVRFTQKPSDDQIRSAISAHIPGREITVQPVVGENEVMIGTELQDERALEAMRQSMVSALAAAFGKPQAGKIDFNNASQSQLADVLRDPLQRAGAGLNEQQLQDVTRAMLDYRNTPPQSGLVNSLDDLSKVPGVTPAVMTALKEAAYTSGYTIRGVEIVGPKVGRELREQALMATLLALAGMLVYIAFRFEWIYGVGAVVAVFHDTIITVGLFSIFNKPIDLTVVAALLTLIGYSMNDTIVIFDRIRENLKILRRENLVTIVNRSINETLSRTALTTGLTFMTVVALFIWGGQVLNGFAFALVVGIIVGTYSTMFIASPIVIFWHNFVNSRKTAAVRAAPVKESVRGGTAKPVK